MILFSPDTDTVPSPQKSECFSDSIQLLLLLSHFFNIRKRQTGKLLSFHFFSGEMHDIFVGLMGRRNSDSGECNGGRLKREKRIPPKLLSFLYLDPRDVLG